jgi:hypothetical protein
MNTYFVTLDETGDVSLFAVDADSPVTAAQKVSHQAEHEPGTTYVVERRDGSDSAEEIEVGVDE